MIEYYPSSIIIEKLELPPEIKDLQHENELLRERVERLTEAIKWKDEKISMVEEKLIEYTGKKKAV